MLNTHTYKDTQVHFCWPCSDLGFTTGGTLLQIPFHPYLSVGRLIFCCWQRLSLETRRLSSLWGFYLCIFITVTKVSAPRSVALCSSLNSCGEVSCFSQTSPPTILAPTEGSRGQTATACSRCSLLVPPKGRALEQIWPLGRRLAGAREDCRAEEAVKQKRSRRKMSSQIHVEEPQPEELEPGWTGTYRRCQITWPPLLWPGVCCGAAVTPTGWYPEWGAAFGEHWTPRSMLQRSQTAMYHQVVHYPASPQGGC